MQLEEGVVREVESRRPASLLREEMPWVNRVCGRVAHISYDLGGYAAATCPPSPSSQHPMPIPASWRCSAIANATRAAISKVSKKTLGPQEEIL